MAKNGFTQPQNDRLAIKRWYEDNTNSYFTPYELMQTVYGSNGTFAKDPIYLETLVERAQKVLNLAEIQVYIKDPEQASAIIAISTLPDTHFQRIKKTKLYELVLQESPLAKQFVKIVNKVAEVCDYLPRIAGDKNKLIDTHADSYKASVFLASFKFLSKDKTNAQDKNDFANTICEAECVFKKQALGNVMHTILKVLANFITHVTGIALIANTINKVKTGRWMLFERNNAEKAVGATRKAVLKDVESLESDENTDRNPK